MPNKEQKFIEIARSFQYHKNLGDFQNVTFVCSQKIEVPISLAEKASEFLFYRCKNEVANSVKKFQEELKEVSGTAKQQSWLEHIEEKERGLEQLFGDFEEQKMKEEAQKVDEQLPIVEVE